MNEPWKENELIIFMYKLIPETARVARFKKSNSLEEPNVKIQYLWMFKKLYLHMKQLVI